MPETEPAAIPATDLDLKKTRGLRKSIVTKSVGALRRAVTERDSIAVTSKLESVKLAFNNFEAAHDDYHMTLDKEPDITESDGYYEEVENKYITAVDHAHLWLSECKNTSKSNRSDSNLLDILSMSQKLIDPFKGDPLHYKEFMAIFDASFYSKQIDDQYKLGILPSPAKST